MSDFEAILKAYEASGGDPSFLRSPQVASLVVSGNKVLGANEISGISMDAEQLPDGVRVHVKVASGVHIELPVHLCFGMIPAEGVQRILSTFEMGEGASAEFLAHCTFPNAVRVQHIMESTIRVGPGARMRYTEAHYHGPEGGVEVLPKAKIVVEERGEYTSEFNLSKGRAGRVDFDYEVDVAAYGVAELLARVIGRGDDEITIRETVRLNGEGARGLAKSRIALRDQAHGRVFSTTEGNAPFSRGHVDCVEIIRDRAVAEAVPVVRVRDDRAQVTHEAAIGTVNRKELETLMSRGLDEEMAVDIIVRGMLGG
ncbi:MAG: SufD family Fe-S cluster assembly protein [Anaerolineae bacterium]|nr:SufD family Fe-S cluster assembly protein [Anaerolineae bacterium]